MNTHLHVITCIVYLCTVISSYKEYTHTIIFGLWCIS